MEFTSDHSKYDRCELNSGNKKKNPILTKSKLTNFSKIRLKSPAAAPFDKTKPRGRRFHMVSCQK